MGRDHAAGVAGRGTVGFTDLAAASADVAKVLFYIFLVIFLVLLVLGLTILRR